MARTWQENMAIWPSLKANFEIKTEKLALIIVDMQNFYMDTNCGLSKLIYEKYAELSAYYFERLKNIVIPNNAKLINYFRVNKYDFIYFTVGSGRRDGKDISKFRSASEIEKQKIEFPALPFIGTYDQEIFPELKPKEEMVLNKVTRSAFSSTGLDRILRNLEKDTLAFTGIATNICIETTARHAADIGYKCVLIEDACATFNKESHDATMINFRNGFGKVMTTDEFISELNKSL